MCDFHSILGISLSEGSYELFHHPDNSHSGMAESRSLRNLPNRSPIFFEAEWDGEGDVPSDEVLIRNAAECPEPLKEKIRAHYEKLKEALASGKYLDSYFKDTKVYQDVWQEAIRRGAPVKLPKEFPGWLVIPKDHKVDASALQSIGGYLDVYPGVTLTAPALQSIGSSLYVNPGVTLTAPALQSIGGSLSVRSGATLTAPALQSVGGYLSVRSGATLDAPALQSVGGSLSVYGTLEAPLLKR